MIVKFVCFPLPRHSTYNIPGQICSPANHEMSGPPQTWILEPSALNIKSTDGLSLCESCIYNNEVQPSIIWFAPDTRAIARAKDITKETDAQRKGMPKGRADSKRIETWHSPRRNERIVMQRPVPPRKSPHPVSREILEDYKETHARHTMSIWPRQLQLPLRGLGGCHDTRIDPNT